MVATAAPSSFFPVTSPSSNSGAKTNKRGNGSASFGRIKSKSAASGDLHVRVNAHDPPKNNGASVGYTTSLECIQLEHDLPSPPPRTFFHELPGWSMLLAAIRTIFLAAEKQWMMLDWKPRRADALINIFGLGRILHDGLVFRQNFCIRSYEIGADRTTSIETLMNHLQETALNHVKTAGIFGDGFGSTPEMCKRNLIWVVTKMQVVVDRYPTWEDVVQIDTWISTSGKNGMRRYWLVHDCKTGDILTRVTSVWVMMNKETRKFSKIPEEVRGEMEPCLKNSAPILEEDGRKLSKLDDNTADYLRSGLTPRWSDLDVNQHVNNVKYIGWILESVPQPILETHVLSAMTLEYRRECGMDSVLQSLTAVSGNGVSDLVNSDGVECKHLLRLENEAEIMRARTEWRPKYSKKSGIPVENA